MGVARSGSFSAAIRQNATKHTQTSHFEPLVVLSNRLPSSCIDAHHRANTHIDHQDHARRHNRRTSSHVRSHRRPHDNLDTRSMVRLDAGRRWRSAAGVGLGVKTYKSLRNTHVHTNRLLEAGSPSKRSHFCDMMSQISRPPTKTQGKTAS